MNSWHSYPKVYAIGHKAIQDIFQDAVIIEEKVDGSQFSFGVFNGKIRCKSHNHELNVDAPEKMFANAVQTVKDIAHKLTDGWTYRGEYLQKPKHNTLVYNRVPDGHIVVFDINTGHEEYMPCEDKKREAERIGLECVPMLGFLKISEYEKLIALLDTDSFLGNSKIEGVVCKNYLRFSRDGHAMMGKFVSERFKEKHDKDWKDRNPGGKDIITILSEKYKTTARWEKAIQHLREDGTLEESPRDIGNLLKEIGLDTKVECADEIKEALFRWVWPQMQRRITAGFPEWYKERLAKSAF